MANTNTQGSREEGTTGIDMNTKTIKKSMPKLTMKKRINARLLETFPAVIPLTMTSPGIRRIRLIKPGRRF